MDLSPKTIQLRAIRSSKEIQGSRELCTVVYYPNKVCMRHSVLLRGAVVIFFFFFFSGYQTPICFKVFWSTTWKIRSVTKFTAVLKIKHLGQAEAPRANKNYF